MARRPQLRPALIAALAAVLAWLVVFAPNAGAYIFFAGGYSNTIGRASLDCSGLGQAFVSGGSYPYGIAADSSHIYWTNYYSGTIGRANLDGTGVDQSFITGATAPLAVAVDASHIYWTTLAGGTTSSGIGRANLDGTGVNQNFITGPLYPSGLAVDADHVYWTDPVGGGSHGIGRANIDGTGVDLNFIPFGNTGWPYRLAVDADHIYWTDPVDAEIGRANLDGTDANGSFITGIGVSPSGPSALALDSGHIYWSDAYNQEIGRANLDGTNPEPGFIQNTGFIVGLALDSQSQIATDMAIGLSASNVHYGDPMSVTATVAPNPLLGSALPTGSVQFHVTGMDDPAPVALDSGGQAAFTPSTLLDVGTTVTAGYSGDGTYSASCVRAKPDVNPAATSTTLESTANPQTVGKGDVTIMATVSNLNTSIVPFGSVQFRINGAAAGEPVVVDADGHAGIVIPATKAGDYVIKADYVDDTGSVADFVPSSATLTETIKAVPIVIPPPTPVVTPTPEPQPEPQPQPPATPTVTPPPPAQLVLGARQAARARCKVPRVKGMTVRKAKKKLKRAHCRVSRRHTHKRLHHPKRGRVIGTRPKAGKKTGGRVFIYLPKKQPKLPKK